MADEQNEVQKEEIVILEKDDGDITPLEDLDKKEEQVETPKLQKKPKKNIFIIAAASGAIALILLIAIILLLKKDETKEQPTKNLEQPKQTQVITQKFSPSKIDDMLKKANSLYESGNKFEALKIYENVAIYNEALSNYNLGVSQMNQSKFEDAISSFKKAIENNENTSVSALNAAVSALEINNEPLFKYYIELANAFLSKESDSSLYDYYNALINYYKGYYIEALHILDSSKNRYYEGQKNYLRSKILSYIYQDKQSIKALENTNTFDTNIPMGLLYARLGEYDLARKYLNKALVDENNADSTKLALALIDIKTGQFGSAALNLKDINDKNSTFISETYPIKTILNPELFDINMAQKKFSVDMLFSKDNIYQILFYFTPYKVFDAKQTINYIRKGGISVFIDENTQADEYLKTSGAISKVNLNLSKTIATALNYNLREANKEFLNIIKIYSGHSILHYNLALTYAQLGNFSEAYRHFITSYHLDSTNYLAGVYAVMTSSMIGKDNKKLISEILDNLNEDSNLNQENIYDSMVQLVLGNNGVLQRWLDTDNSTNILNIVFDIIAAQITGRKDIIISKTDKLKEILPNDIMANILYSTARFTDNNIKDYARDIQHGFFNNNVNKKALYGGANIIRIQYIKLLQIAGLLNVERDRIKSDLEISTQNAQNILQTLAYIDLFTANFEESYSIYNELIDNKNVNDPNTLFLASVASIGARHLESAIGYLELSKLVDPTSIEDRLALGMLYQEVGNIDAAISQYENIGNTSYKSEFFTFELVN